MRVTTHGNFPVDGHTYSLDTAFVASNPGITPGWVDLGASGLFYRWAEAGFGGYIVFWYGVDKYTLSGNYVGTALGDPREVYAHTVFKSASAPFRMSLDRAPFTDAGLAGLWVKGKMASAAQTREIWTISIVEGELAFDYQEPTALESVNAKAELFGVDYDGGEPVYTGIGGGVSIDANAGDVYQLFTMTELGKKYLSHGQWHDAVALFLNPGSHSITPGQSAGLTFMRDLFFSTYTRSGTYGAGGFAWAGTCQADILSWGGFEFLGDWQAALTPGSLALPARWRVAYGYPPAGLR